MKEFRANEMYDLKPEEVKELNKQGYVFVWVDHSRKSGNHHHSKGEPRIREYMFIGKNEKGKDN